MATLPVVVQGASKPVSKFPFKICAPPDAQKPRMIRVDVNRIRIEQKQLMVAVDASDNARNRRCLEVGFSPPREDGSMRTWRIVNAADWKAGSVPHNRIFPLVPIRSRARAATKKIWKCKMRDRTHD